MGLQYLNVGTIRLTKKKDKLYICLNQTTNKSGKYVNDNLVELYNALGDFIENPDKNGLALQIEKPQDEARRLCELGYIEEDELESRLNKIPDYIKYNIKYVQEVED